MRIAIETDGAPAALGPYSQAVRAGHMLFVSGQLPLDPVTGQLTPGGAGPQTDRVLQNARAILAAAGASLADVARTTVYLADLAEFGAMNEAYGRYFGAPAPARATVQAAALPLGARVEIDLIAVQPE